MNNIRPALSRPFTNLRIWVICDMKDFTDPERHTRTLKAILSGKQHSFDHARRKMIALDLESRIDLSKDHPNVKTIVSDVEAGRKPIRFTLLDANHYSAYPEIDGIFNVLIKEEGSPPDLEAVFAPWLIA